MIRVSNVCINITVTYTLLFSVYFPIHIYYIRVPPTLLLSLHFLKKIGGLLLCSARVAPQIVARICCVLHSKQMPASKPHSLLPSLSSYLRERQCKEAERGERIRKKSRYKGIHLTNCANLFITRKTTATAAGHRCRRHSRSQRGQEQSKGAGVGSVTGAKTGAEAATEAGQRSRQQNVAK